MSAAVQHRAQEGYGYQNGGHLGEVTRNPSSPKRVIRRPRIHRRAQQQLKVAFAPSVKQVRTNAQISSQFQLGLFIQLLPPMLLFLALVFQLWIRVEIVESGYHLETLRQRAVNKDVEVRRLKSQIAMNTTPRVLVVRASKELHMGVPTVSQVRRIGQRSR